MRTKCPFCHGIMTVRKFRIMKHRNRQKPKYYCPVSDQKMIDVARMVYAEAEDDDSSWKNQGIDDDLLMELKPS